MDKSVQYHGGLDLTELSALQIDAKNIIDFSVNSNPYGPFPKVKDAVAGVDISRYPDREVSVLRRLLADANHVRAEEILIGNGTAEIIWLAAHAFFAGKRVLVFGPTFGEYRRASMAVGADVEVRMAAGPVYRFDVDEMCHHIETMRPDVVFLCNPNNPTGQVFSSPEIESIIKKMGDRLLVLDEAYRTFYWDEPFGGYPANNVLVLRSMTKDFALAGLRLGYAIASGEIINALKNLQPPWSVNNAAQTAGEAVFCELETLHKTISQLRKDAACLQQEIDRPGFQVVKSPLHYFLVDVTPVTGGNIRRTLLSKGIHVRDCQSFGLPRHIRIGSQLPHENERLLEVLSHISTL